MAEIIQPTCIEGLYTAPANIFLDGIEATHPLTSDLYSHERLRKSLKGLEYDFCFIDTPPSLGWLTQSAFYASNQLRLKMSNTKSIASGFFNKNTTSQTLVAQPSPPNALQSIFDIQKLEESETRQLEKLLADEFRPGGNVSEEQVTQDLETLKHITAEVKGISKQGVLLIGERIHKAREILKNYGDGKGSLKKWLEITFSNSRRTAYNALAYFDFHRSLPDDKARVLLKKMPQKAAYALASREGEIEVKTEIVRDYHQQKAEDIIPVIQERLPLPQDKKALSKDATTQLLEKMDIISKKIHSRKIHISTSQRKIIGGIVSNLRDVLQE